MQLVVRDVRRTVQWMNPNRVLVFLDSTDRSEAKVFRAHAPPQGACENLVCAQLRRDSRLKMTDDLRRFIKVDNHEAANIGDLGEVLGGTLFGRAHV